MKDIYNLKNGETYQVIKEFADFDGKVHAAGETWVFEKTTYLPYNSGLSLFVVKNGRSVMHRFQDEPEKQQEILDNFMSYVEAVKT